MAPFVTFPLSGPPLCVSLTRPEYKDGCVHSVHDKRMGANFFVVSEVTPIAKFDLVPSLEHDGLLHVRCCDTSKYWVAQQLREDDGSSSWFIRSAADEPEEDLNNPSCTLFDFRTYSIDTEQFRIYLPLQKKYVSMYGNILEPPPTYLKLRDVEDSSEYSYMSFFQARRVSQQKKVLPKYVSFIGANGKYLTYKDPYLEFSSSDATEPAVVHETSTDDYGDTRIRSIGSGKFWSDSYKYSSWMCANAEYDDWGSTFKVIMIDNSRIALQAIERAEGNFCESLSDGGKTERLSSSAKDYSTTKSLLMFEEAVSSRHIYDVEYRVGGKKTSTNKKVSRQVVRATNRTHEPHKVEQILEMYDRKERTWNLDLNVDAGIKTHFTASLPIRILEVEAGTEGEVEFHADFNWGKTKKEESKRSSEYKYAVPPMKKVICSVFSREDVVEVPFSYKQKDVLYNGEMTPPRQFHDGIYRGITSFDTDIENLPEEIVADEQDVSTVI